MAYFSQHFIFVDKLKIKDIFINAATRVICITNWTLQLISFIVHVEKCLAKTFRSRTFYDKS